MSRLLATLLVGLLLFAPAAAGATERVKVGVLKLTSSAPLFVGIEKGFFQEHGIEPELVFFQAAAPIATAIATGQVDVGATGLTAALYNIVLGGEQLWIVADKGREWPGYPLTAIVVQTALWEGGRSDSQPDASGRFTLEQVPPGARAGVDGHAEVGRAQPRVAPGGEHERRHAERLGVDAQHQLHHRRVARQRDLVDVLGHDAGGLAHLAGQFGEGVLREAPQPLEGALVEHGRADP